MFRNQKNWFIGPEVWVLNLKENINYVKKFIQIMLVSPHQLYSRDLTLAL